MSLSPGSPNPCDIEDLKNPLFMAWLKSELDDRPVKPDSQDYDEPFVTSAIDAEAAELYRLAQARKIMRMYATWKANQN